MSLSDLDIFKLAFNQLLQEYNVKVRNANTILNQLELVQKHKGFDEIVTNFKNIINEENKC